MAQQVEIPILVGVSVSDISLNFAQALAIALRGLQSENSKDLSCAWGFLSGYIKAHGESIVETLLNEPHIDKLSENGIATALLLLPKSKENWNKVAAFGEKIENLYWLRVNHFSDIAGKPEEKSFMITKLLQVGRSLDAVYFIAYFLNEKKGLLDARQMGKMLKINHTEQKKREYEKIITECSEGLTKELLIQALNEAIQEVNKKKIDGNDATMSQYNILLIFQELDRNNEVSKEEIANLEWMYFPLLEYSFRPPIALHEAMSMNPEFFVKVLSTIYTPLTDDQNKEKQEIDKDYEAIASRAFGLLHSWHLVPGETNGIIDGTILENWILQVKILCKSSGLPAIGDQNVGRILAFSLAELNGVWPSIPVRNIIQKFSNRELEKGIVLGISEKRGVTSRTMTEGGIQEKMIASNYRKWAHETKIKWPKVAAILRSIATHFDDEGKYFDDDSERTD